MSKLLQWRPIITAVLASLVLAAAALAQMPINPWKKAAPFPEPDEELYGVAVNGKMYVIGGWDDGKAGGVNYEYNPATDKWTKKKSMPRPAHHAALATVNGKIYVLGGFVVPKETQVPVGGAWEPIDDAWVYDPASDSWESLAPLPGKRGSALAVEVGGKIYLIGGATTVEGSKDPYFTFFGPARILSSNDVYDPATNKWESRRPMAVPRNHAFGGAVNGKIYVIGGRTGHAFILSATNTDVVEEYNPVGDMWSAPKDRMPTPRSGGAWGTDGRMIYVAGGEVTTNKEVGAFRGIEAYDPAINAWFTLPFMPMPRHGVAGAVIGNEFHLVSGMVQSAGALTFLDPHLNTHTAAHDVLELTFNPSPPAPSKSDLSAPSAGPNKLHTRYNLNSPQGQIMLAKYARAIEIMKTLPDYDTILGTGGGIRIGSRAPPRSCGITPGKRKRKSSPLCRRSIRPMPRRCGTAAKPTRSIPPTLRITSSGISSPGTGSCFISSRESFARCCTMRVLRFRTGTRSPEALTISQSPPRSGTQAPRCITALAGPG
jgi:N-acetylneuraminic acid mutarotase